MLRLACVSCGASLEITADLDQFACGYCGSQQRVERSGGTVALKKIEVAIRAVQRGTDLTAAELALPRLAKERQELKTEIAAAIVKANVGRTQARFVRMGLTIMAFPSIAIIIWPLFIKLFSINSPGFEMLGGIIALIAPFIAYYGIKIPPDSSNRVTASYQEKVDKLLSRIEQNRNILDSSRN
jgi:hypothetical protein